MARGRAPGCVSVSGAQRGLRLRASASCVSSPATPSTSSATRSWKSRTAVFEVRAVERAGLHLEALPLAGRVLGVPRLELLLERGHPPAARAVLQERLRRRAEQLLEHGVARQHRLAVVAAGRPLVGVALAVAGQRAAGARVVGREHELRPVGLADALRHAEVEVAAQERRGVLRRGLNRRLPSRSARAVLAQEVRVRAVVDLEEPAPVAAVADDVVHVRLLGRDREEQPDGQILLGLGRRHRLVPLLRARSLKLCGKLGLRERTHGAPTGRLRSAR